MKYTRDLILLALVLLNAPAESHLRVLRARGVAEPEAVPKSGERNGVKFEVTGVTEMEAEQQTDCVCKLGTFWHIRIQACIPQGDWGYECGFFPKEHWHRVCKDGLKCVPLEQQDSYRTFGNKGFKKAETQAATCVPCHPEDECPTGEARHTADCPKANFVTGETCVTVKVGAKGPTAEASVEQTEKATATEKHAATATAEATRSATAHAKEDPSITATAKATVKATGKGEAEHEATASATGEATKKANSEANGNNKACVGVADAVKGLGLKKDILSVDEGSMQARVGEVLRDKIMTYAKKTAFEKALRKASKGAIATSVEAAEAQATKEATKEATAEAKEEAKMEAKGKAKAAAKDKAMDKAEADAKDKAATDATQKAKAEAQVKADAAYDAKMEAEAKAKAKLTAEEKARLEAAAKKKAAAEAEAKAKAEAEAKAKKKADAKQYAKDKKKAQAAAAEAMSGDTSNIPGSGPPGGAQKAIPSDGEPGMEEVPKVPNAGDTFNP